MSDLMAARERTRRAHTWACAAATVVAVADHRHRLDAGGVRVNRSCAQLVARHRSLARAGADAWSARGRFGWPTMDRPTHDGRRTPSEEGGVTMERSVPRQRFPHPPEPNPALVEEAKQRAKSAQNRIADRITAFAGSMWFIYIHVVWFGCWIGFGVEQYPFGLLTMIVSLEAIFLSTFVLISQNRADAKRQAIADLEWQTVQQRGRAKPRTAQPLRSDPRTHDSDSRQHELANRPSIATARMSEVSTSPQLDVETSASGWASSPRT